MSFSLSEYIKVGADWGFAPDPTGRAYSAPPTLPSWLKGVASPRRGCNGGGKGGRIRTDKWNRVGKAVK